MAASSEAIIVSNGWPGRVKGAYGVAGAIVQATPLTRPGHPGRQRLRGAGPKCELAPPQQVEQARRLVHDDGQWHVQATADRRSVVTVRL